MVLKSTVTLNTRTSSKGENNNAATFYCSNKFARTLYLTRTSTAKVFHIINVITMLMLKKKMNGPRLSTVLLLLLPLFTAAPLYVRIMLECTSQVQRTVCMYYVVLWGVDFIKWLPITAGGVCVCILHINQSGLNRTHSYILRRCRPVRGHEDDVRSKVNG